MTWLSRHRLGIWAFLVSVAFIPGIMSAAVAGRWWLIALGVPLMGKIEFRFMPWVQVAVMAGMAWAVASLATTPDGWDGFLQLLFMTALVGVMGVASQAESLDEPMMAMCLGLGVSSAFCLSRLAGHQLTVEGGSDNYAGLFYNSEVLTEFAAPMLVWAIAKKKWWLASLTVTPILINWSRVSVAVAIFGIAFAYWPKSWKWRALVSIGTLTAICGSVFYLSLYANKIGGAAQRVVMWLATAYAITIPGHGLGWYRASHLTEEFAHSDVLQSLAELGAGALFFAVIIVYAFRHRGDLAEKAAFVAICIELIVSFPLHVPAGGFLAALLAGFLVRDCSYAGRAGLCGRDQDGADGEWDSAVRDRFDRGSGRRGGLVSVRSQIA